MKPFRYAVATLFVVSAFSSFPSPFYRGIADQHALGNWTTATLFAVHGVAVITAMLWIQLVARRSLANAATPRRLLVLALALDAVGGLVLVFAIPQAALLLIALGRIITGFALGVATPVLTSTIAARPLGSMFATAAILAGVGVGAAVAGGAVFFLVPVPLVFGCGVAALLFCLVILPRPFAMEAPLAVIEPGSAGATCPPRVVLWCVLLAFAANGVLGLFTSVLPGDVSMAIGGGTLAAGATVAATMITAGLARIVAKRCPQRAVRTIAYAAAGIGLVLFAVGMASGSTAAALIGAAGIGAACGIAYDTSIEITARRASSPQQRLRAVARVQRAGQLGLVIPVFFYPLVVHG